MKYQDNTIKGWIKPVAIAVVGGLALIVGGGALTVLSGCNGYQEFKSTHPEVTRKDYNALVEAYDINKDIIEPHIHDLAKTNKNITLWDGISDREKAEAVLEMKKQINAAVVGNTFMSCPGN